MKQAWDNGNKNGLRIHRGIDVYDKNDVLVLQLREDTLKPKSNKFITDVIDQEFFNVRLSNPPKESLDQEIPLDRNRSLIIYPRYQKGCGEFNYRPHR